MLWQRVSLLFAVLYNSCHASSDYNEQLLVRPLPESALLASFTFQSNTSVSAFEQQDFRFFPRSLGQILQHARTKELHLRFRSGRWDEPVWGLRPRGGSREGGTGVELWAWVEAESDEEANERWLTLTNALSGLFCASINFIDLTRTIKPVLSFSPEGDHASHENLHLLHGSLPHEVVCTENLTPFLKLLPCKGKAGISSLLDGHKLYDSSWQSMAIDVRPVCADTSAECVFEVEQTIDMVLDIERSKRSRDDPVPRPVPVELLPCDTSKPYHNHGDSCYPVSRPSMPSFTLEEVFGKPLRGSCQVSGEDVSQAKSICLELPHDRSVDVITQANYTELFGGEQTRCYSIADSQDFDIHVKEQNDVDLTMISPSVLRAERNFNGHGQEHGSVEATISNLSPEPVELVYLEILPWFMKPYLHTLQTTVTSTNPSSQPPSPDLKVVLQTYYRPSVDRHRSTQLELVLSIPAASTAKLTYDFDKSILRYTEYPPDANRGFDAAPAIIRVLAPEHLAQQTAYIRTTSLLLYLPTPDFSMPYNVIILTSTVIALGFGSLFNLLVRRFVSSDEVPKSDLKARLRARVAALKARFGRKGKTE